MYYYISFHGTNKLSVYIHSTKVLAYMDDALDLVSFPSRSQKSSSVTVAIS